MANKIHSPAGLAVGHGLSASSSLTAASHNRQGGSGLSATGWRLMLALATVYIVWGTTYYAIIWVVADIPPLWANGLRFVMAAAVMAAWAVWRGQALPNWAQWRHAAITGTLMVFMAMGAVVYAQKLGVGSGLMATVVATMPLWLALWTRLGGESVSRPAWVGLALGAAGAGLLAFEGDFATSLLGAALAFAAPVCWSLGSWLSRRQARCSEDATHAPAQTAKLAGPAMMAAAQWFFGGALSLFVAFWIEPTPQWQAVSLEAWLAWAYLTVVGTLLTLNVYLWLLKNTSSALAGSYSFVNPAVALAVGVGLAGEQFTGTLYLALPLILAALLLILHGHRVPWARIALEIRRFVPISRQVHL